MAKDPSQVLETLQKQFNGEEQHDLDILRNYCRTLEHNDENLAIITAIGRYVLEHYPDADAVQQAQKFEKAHDDWTHLIEEAQKALKSGDFEEAIRLYDEIIGEVTPNPDPKTYYFAFSHPFEETIVRAMHQHDDRAIERIPQLPELLYFQRGCVYFELKDYAKARESLMNSLRLNPVCCRTRFELIQLEKAEKHWDAIRTELRKIHPMIFTRHYLSRFYREYANLAIWDNDPSLAVALLYLSLDYEDAKVTHHLLDSLKEQNVDVSQPSVEEIKRRLTDAEIPIGPYPTVYEHAIDIGKQMKHVYPEAAKMAFAIAYDLTHYQPLLKELQ